MQLINSGYFNQTDDNSCGPIATLNAEIWQGKSYDTDGWEILEPRRYLLKTRHNNFPVRGTLWEDMDRVVRELGISQIMTTDLITMKQALEKGDALIVMISYSDQRVTPGCRIDAHYIFVYPENNSIHVVNEVENFFANWETFEQKYLSNNPADSDGNVFPRAWIVKQFDLS